MTITTKTILAISLAGLAAIQLLPPGSTPDSAAPWVILGLLAFGLFNVFVEPRGTFGVRRVAILSSFLALATPLATAIVLLLAWLVWPPAFLVTWILNRDAGLADDPQTEPRLATTAKITTAAIIAVVAVASVIFRLMTRHGLDQSATLFVGVPALLAIAAVFSPTPRSAVGVACKAVTIGLLVSLIFLGEGMLCIAMSAPLFYLVAVIVGVSADRMRARAGNPGRKLMSSAALLALIPMSLEGITPSMSFNRDMSVSETQIVRASEDEVAAAIRETPRFDRALPFYLRAGFPRPTSTRIDADQSRWVIRMRGGEMRLNGMEPRAGDLVLALDDTRPGLIEWRAISDDSHMTHFLDWRGARVEWMAIDAQTTRVTWTLRYRRRLDPAWYFGPMEAYATRLAARYLIDAVATP